MNSLYFSIKKGAGPVIAVANHHGHALRPEVTRIMGLDAAARLQEEDPFTGEWADIVPTSLVAQHSRFEVDLNRPRESAVYMNSDDAWGLEVWKQLPPDSLIEASLAQYDAYYTALESLCRDKQEHYGNFVVLDLHSYNYRRDGPAGPEADPAGNPEVNIGTGTMNRERWGGLVDRFIHELRSSDFLGRSLDVRENVKFVGRQFPKWVHTHYPDSGCAIAVEFKKFFMDEWTGKLDLAAHDAIKRALASTLPGLEEELEKVRARY
jgi:N-formylglutamate deformylase